MGSKDYTEAGLTTRSVGQLQVDDGVVRVLLIEDNLLDQHVVRNMLTGLAHVRYEVRAISDFAAAADALGQPFDICLLDYILGRHSALELLKHFRAESLPGPVVLLTGQTDLSVEKAAAEHGNPPDK